MVGGVEQLLEDLQHVMTEIEGLVKETAATAGDGAGDAVQGLEAILTRSRRRLRKLEKEVRHDVGQRVHSADRYVRENTWRSLAMAAGAAFVVGVLLGRRD
jgi:ElaB/YqjD/DUF883 family membrane-anchored ribosome-binding protein